MSDEQGGVLPGATVTAVHEPTGTNYEGVTQGDGRFSLVNVRVGGPYQLVVALPGFRSETLNAVTVTLGETTELPVKLLLQSVTEVVQVTAESIPLFTASKAGTSDNVGTEVLETLPTINRSIQDFARVSPHFVQYAFNGDPSALSVAGPEREEASLASVEPAGVAAAGHSGRTKPRPRSKGTSGSVTGLREATEPEGVADDAERGGRRDEQAPTDEHTEPTLVGDRSRLAEKPRLPMPPSPTSSTHVAAPLAASPTAGRRR